MMVKQFGPPRYLAALILLAAAAHGAEYFVDGSNVAASDSNPGTAALPWKTIGKANQTLRAGDAVQIKRGTYGTTISPARTGTATAPIAYSNYGSDVVTITGALDGIDFTAKNFIFISGLNFTNNGTFFSLRASTNCVIRDCTFKGMLGQNNWSGARLIGSSQSNRIENCTFERWGYFTSTDDIGDLLDFGDDTVLNDFTWYNVVEGCTISAAAHSLMNLRSGRTIVRNNYFHNEIWSSGHGSRCIISDAPQETGGWNLFESNRIAFAGAAPDATAGSGINLRTRNSIVRFNAFYNNTDAGVFMDGGDNTSDAAMFNHIYGNTFYRNGINASDSQASIGLQNYGTAFQIMSNAVLNNIMRGALNVYYVRGAGVSLSQQTLAGNWQEAGDPQFVDVTTPYGPGNPALPNFALKPTSPCIDAGVFLTKITSVSGTGNAFQVADPQFFMDGWGMINGDVIQLQGSTKRAVITNVNYATRTVSVNTALSWTQNQGVSLAYEGTAPDIGAFEYGISTAPANTPPVVQVGQNQSIAFPVVTVQLTGQATDAESDPLAFTWSMVSGPAAVTFANNNQSNTVVTISTRGAYTFRLSVSDGFSASAADVSLNFEPDSSTIMLEAEVGALSQPFIVESGYVLQTALTSLPSSGRATYPLDIPVAGDYLVTALVDAPDEGANSLFVSMDREPVEPQTIWDIAITAGFQWRTVTWRVSGTPVTPQVFSLSAGAHTLIIRGREAGVKLDQIELVRVNVPTAPVLQIARLPVGHAVVLSWPLGAGNCILETSPSFHGTNWTPVLPAAVVSGDTCLVTNAASATSGYFRLRQQ